MDGSQPVRLLIILSPGEGGAIELGHIAPAYYLFKDFGADVVLATVTGGFWALPDLRNVDPVDPVVQRFLADRSARDDLADTLRLHQIVIDDFDAGLCLGFCGDLWQGAGDDGALLLRALLESGRPVAVIPGKGIVLSPHGAGGGLLIIGDAKGAPNMAAHALLKVVMERRRIR